MPPGAVHAGQDLDGGPIYVGRAYHQGDLLPAKICPSHRCAFVSHGGRQVEEHTYEVRQFIRVTYISLGDMTTNMAALDTAHKVMLYFVRVTYIPLGNVTSH